MFLSSMVAGNEAAGRGRSPSNSARSDTLGRLRPREARKRTAASGPTSASSLATGRGRLSAMRSTNRSSWAWASAMVTAVMVRQKRWVAKWMDFSTEPFRLPRRGGQATTLAP